MEHPLARLRDLRDQLAAWPAARLLRERLDPPEFPIDEDYEEELLVDADLVLDDAMRAFFGEVGTVHLAWQVDDRRGGVVRIPSLDDVARSRIADVEAMAARDDAERAHLALDLADATQWTAFPADRAGVPELWMRTEDAGGRIPLDAPLTLDFAGYLEHLLGTRGVCDAHGRDPAIRHVRIPRSRDGVSPGHAAEIPRTRPRTNRHWTDA